MSRTKNHRAKAWGRGPFPLRLETMESRELLAASVAAAAAAVAPSLPDITGVSLSTSSQLYWGDSLHAQGTVINQGTTATTSPFNVGIYASSNPTGANAVLIGEATIPAGLAPGAKATFNQAVVLPTTSIPTNAAGQIYIATAIDPEKTLSEGSTANNSGVGVGVDSTPVTIASHGPAQLVGSSFSVTPSQAAWGSSVQISAQIQNNGQGNSPATIASIVLSPPGQSPGSPGDVTLQHINVPALDAGQMATITQSVVLPAIPPTTLAGGTTYTLSIVADSAFQTNTLAPHVATRGLGLDMAQMTITTPSGAPTNSSPQPNLDVVSVTAPTTPIALGQTFQVTSDIQNNGTGDSVPVTLRYLLVGADGSLSNGIFLADATLTGLKAGYGQKVVQNLQLPKSFPAGLTLNSSGTAKIAVIANPENTVNMASVANNSATSKTILIQYVNSDGKTVNPNPSTTGSTTGGSKKARKVSAAEAALVAKAKTLTTQEKLNIANQRLEGHSISHNIKAFPKRAETYFKNLFKL